MQRFLLSACATLVVTVAIGRDSAAQYPYVEPYNTAAAQAASVGQGLPWHNKYYHQSYGEPYALVVPPTAEYQTHYAWGVGGMRNTPIFHQYGRTYPGSAPASYRFRHPPYWPDDTNQFGVYYIRGPW
ncbi:MAG: hypothetical protein QM811_15460 [Pirellulales bacterium]